jgi:uncharacterized protein (DUF952 family)
MTTGGGAGEHPVDQLIYHCAGVTDWVVAQAEGEYTMSSRGRTLAEEGFVHASFVSQVPGVLQRFYADVTEPLCLLVIDPRKLRVRVVTENLEGGEEKFPHVYGPIPVDAVTSVVELQHDADGWHWPGRA